MNQLTESQFAGVGRAVGEALQRQREWIEASNALCDTRLRQFEQRLAALEAAFAGDERPTDPASLGLMN